MERENERGLRAIARNRTCSWFISPLWKIRERAGKGAEFLTPHFSTRETSQRSGSIYFIIVMM